MYANQANSSACVRIATSSTPRRRILQHRHTFVMCGCGARKDERKKRTARTQTRLSRPPHLPHPPSAHTQAARPARCSGASALHTRTHVKIRPHLDNFVNTKLVRHTQLCLPARRSAPASSVAASRRRTPRGDAALRRAVLPNRPTIIATASRHSRGPPTHARRRTPQHGTHTAHIPTRKAARARRCAPYGNSSRFDGRWPVALPPL